MKYRPRMPLEKRLWILREIEIGKEYAPKAIAKRHGLHQGTIYRLWRQRATIRRQA